MMHAVAICNQKGGVGKSTLTINLGAALAQIGLRVLLIDLDPQGHLTEGVGLQDYYLSNEASLYDFLIGAPKNLRIQDIVRPHAFESYHVIPSNYQLMLAEQSLYLARNREHKLKTLLPAFKDSYDWVLIDCPPTLGNLTDNAMNAARQVVIPIQAEPTSVRALEILFDQIESLERGLNIQIRILAVVPNMVLDSVLAKRILSDLRGSIPSVVPFEIRKRVMLQEAWDQGHSIFATEGATAVQIRNRDEIIDLYRKLADVVIAQAQGEPPDGR